MNSGADDFLNKPFNTQELLKVINLRIKKSSQAKDIYTNEIKGLKEEVVNLHNSINNLSYNNSHMLRAPLLKVLGLINYLIEESEDKSNLNNDVLKMLKESCLELSDATEGIEQLLNNMKS